MERTPGDIINEFLHLDMIRTIRGDEVKGWRPDSDEGGVTKFYLNQAECEVLSRAFAKLAEELNVSGHVKLY